MRKLNSINFMDLVNEESEILPYVQVNKLVSHSFIDVGRRHKTPGSETKGSYY